MPRPNQHILSFFKDNAPDVTNLSINRSGKSAEMRSDVLHQTGTVYNLLFAK